MAKLQLFVFKYILLRAGEVAQHLRGLSILAGDQSWVPNIHARCTTTCNSNCRRSNPLLPLLAPTNM